MAIINGTSVTVVNGPPVPGQETAVIPGVQAEDGSYVGTSYSGDPNNPTATMVAFDQSGNVLWTVNGDQPQIATADGGVIGQSGITYDANGNVTGQVGVPTQSWPGYGYQVGSVEDVLRKIVSVAKSWWPFAGGNNSGNGTAVPPLWFPSLDNCALTLYGRPAACPAPGDLMENAMQDLVSQLSTDPQCKTAAQQWVFSEVTFGGLFDWIFTSPVDPKQFVSYLQRTPDFYDGPQSTFDYHQALCGENRTLCNATGSNPPHTVGFHFGDAVGVTAVTVSPSEPLKSFWQPAYTPPGPSDNGFGVGIDPSTNRAGAPGANIQNESNLFHEVLHGMTGLYDNDLLTIFGYASGASPVNISIYIRNKVLNSCPRFR